MKKIHILPALQDNYIYLLEFSNGLASVIDPGEAAPVIEAIEKLDIKLTHILNTHHHSDHIGGNEVLRERYGAKIVAPDDDRIPNIDIRLREGDRFAFNGNSVQVIETPGHTKTHICFYFARNEALFTGDTVFSMGCGRLFEGTPEEMWDSFQKILKLPGDTNIYCGHEYTVMNGRFCAGIEPGNKDIKKRLQEAESLREQGLPTLPVTLATEKKTNVFLRAKTAADLAAVRERKNVA